MKKETRKSCEIIKTIKGNNVRLKGQAKGVRWQTVNGG